MHNDIQSARVDQKNRIYALIIDRFNLLVREQGLSIRELADKLNQRPIDVERLLKNPQYWTLEIISDLLYSMDSELHTEINAKNTKKRLNFDPDQELQITA